MNRQKVLSKLERHIISRASHPHIPPSLDGEILLEEHRGAAGELLGVVSISIDNLLDLPDLSDDKKEKKRKDRADFTYDEMVACDPNDEQGYYKYFDKWRKEGLC